MASKATGFHDLIEMTAKELLSSDHKIERLRGQQPLVTTLAITPSNTGVTTMVKFDHRELEGMMSPRKLVDLVHARLTVALIG